MPVLKMHPSRWPPRRVHGQRALGSRSTATKDTDAQGLHHHDAPPQPSQSIAERLLRLGADRPPATAPIPAPNGPPPPSLRQLRHSVARSGSFVAGVVAERDPSDPLNPCVFEQPTVFLASFISAEEGGNTSMPERHVSARCEERMPSRTARSATRLRRHATSLRDESVILNALACLRRHLASAPCRGCCRLVHSNTSLYPGHAGLFAVCHVGSYCTRSFCNAL